MAQVHIALINDAVWFVVDSKAKLVARFTQELHGDPNLKVDAMKCTVAETIELLYEAGSAGQTCEVEHGCLVEMGDTYADMAFTEREVE